MANQITVNSGTGNITVTTSRSVIGTVANVASANYANFAGEANTANSATVAASANSVALANVVGAGNIASVNLDGNVSNVLRGDGTFSGIPDSANANFANFAGTVTNSAQPNITSLGTLGNLTVSGGIQTNDLTVTGNFSVGNLVANNANYANFAGVAYSVDGANVSGEVAVANTVSNPTQSNITAVGTLGNLDVSGTITANVIQANTIEANLAFTNVDYIDFDTANGSPGFQTGRVYWDSTKLSLAVDMNGSGNITQQVGEDQYIYVKANATITAGQVAMFNGVQGDTILAAPANTASAGFLPRYVIGVAPANIASGNSGYIQTFGEVYDLQTNAFSAGSILYLQANSAGALTATEPTAPDPKIVVAACLVQSNSPSATNGKIQVRPDFGYYMDQLHDVSNATPSTGDVLVYNASNVYAPSNTVPVANVVSDNAQPNITSVGNLTSLTVTGNVSTGNLVANPSLFVDGDAGNVLIQPNVSFNGSKWGVIYRGEYDANTLDNTLNQAFVTDNYSNQAIFTSRTIANTANGNVAYGGFSRINNFGAVGNSETDPTIPSFISFTAASSNSNLASSGTATHTSMQIGGGFIAVVGEAAGDTDLSGAWRQFQYRPKAMDFIRRNGNGEARTGVVANDETSLNFYGTQIFGANPATNYNYPAKMGSKVDPGWTDPGNGSAGVPEGLFFVVVDTNFSNTEHRMYANGTTTFNAFKQDVNGNSISVNPIILGSDGVITANGSGLTALTGANVTGEVAFAATANSVALANVSGIGNIANINLDGNASNILFGNGVFAAAPTVGNADSISNGNSSIGFTGVDGNAVITINNANTAVVSSNQVEVTGNIVSTASNVTISDIPGTFTFDFYPSYSKRNEYDPDYGALNFKSAELHLIKNFDASQSFAIVDEHGYYVEDTANAAVAAAGYDFFEVADSVSGNPTVPGLKYTWIPVPESDLAGFAVGTWTKHSVGGNASGIETTIGANIGTKALHQFYNYSPVGIKFDRRNGNGKNTGSRLPVSADDYLADIQWQPYGKNGGGATAIVSSPAKFGAKVDAGYTGANAEVVPTGFEFNTVSSNGALKTHSFYANGSVTFSSSGTITGNGAGLSSLAGANVTGEVSFAATANSVALANVSGVGNIANINIDGNINNVLRGDGTFGIAGIASTIQNGTSNVYFTGSGGDLSIKIDGNVKSQFGPDGLKLLGANTGPSDVSKLEITNGSLNWVLDNTNFAGGTPFGMQQYNNAGSLAYGLNFYRARGDFASQADVQSGDQGYSRQTQFRYGNTTVTAHTELVIANTFSGSDVGITHAFSADSDTANSKFDVTFGEARFSNDVTANGNIAGSNVTATSFVVLASDTVANLTTNTPAVVGVAGAMIAVSDQDYQPAHWSVTDNVWKYVSNRANV